VINESGHSGISFAKYWYFSITIFLSSFLLFQIQPIMGKYILPWFGGTSTVWTTCMMVYQFLLLGGYIYAHRVAGLTLRRQVYLHVSILGVSVLLFAYLWMKWNTPITPGQDWQPVDGTVPILRILEILMLCIGLPFLLLSSTSSLIQNWSSIISPDKSPYGFYMISNIGSMLGLVTYPLLFEPYLHLRTQAFVWSGSYVAFTLICGACALVVLRKKHGQPDKAAVPASTGAETGTRDKTLPSGVRQATWLVLSFLPCALLLATSNEMTQNIAPVPLLWVLPLALYLLSFIICFSPFGKPFYKVFVFMIIICSFLICMIIQDPTKFGITIALSILSCALFFSCMLCNTLLYSLRPAAVHLTRYYVIIALGGALGGIFVGLIAPLTFKAYYEFGLCLIAVCLIAIGILLRERKAWSRFPWTAMVFFSVIVLFLLSVIATHVPSHTIFRSRNFYGAVSVRSLPGPHGWVRHSLLHGRIAHGVQILHSPVESKPVSYYAKEGGVGYAMQRFSFRPYRIGVIGLGAGMMCTYAQTGDYLKFYEINSDVVKIARNPEFFSYLSACSATVDMVMGDARISMERELKSGKPQNFDVLVIDAFNGDSVPVHLLTREAFKVYLAHLAPAGIIAVNVSNTYLDLVPAVWAQKKHFDLDGAVIFCRKNYRTCADASNWVLLSRDSSFFLMPEIRKVALRTDVIRQVEGWTDDYSSLLPAVRKLRFDLSTAMEAVKGLLKVKKVFVND